LLADMKSRGNPCFPCLCVKGGAKGLVLMPQHSELALKNNDN
jgi:hypothetical protein